MSTLDFVDQRKTYLLKGLRHFHMAAKTLCLQTMDYAVMTSDNGAFTKNCC